MWTLSALERLGADLRYAVRHLARRPTWTLVVVSTLALGIGANTAIFTLIDSMLFKPASWNKDNRLVWVVSLATNSGRMSYADYITYRDRATTLTGVLAFGGSGVSVGSAHPQRVLSGFVSGNYFDVLGLRPVVGRTFRPDEDAETGGQPVAVLSHAFWTEQFAADPRVVNTVVTINGQPFTIIGVAPPGFTGVAYANDAEHLWLPLAMHGTVMRTGAASPAASTSRWLRVVGRLRDGATAAQAAAELRVIGQQAVPAGTRSDREKGTRVVPVRGGLNPWEQRELAPVFGLIAIVPLLVLLVACTNVANLLMSRNLSRSKELAMRLAIGASRARLVRLLLTESLVLALLSAVVGFAFSFGVIRLMMRFGNLPTDDLHLLTPDGRALFATTLLAIATTLVFGLAPALTVTKAALLPALKEEGGTTSGRGARLRRAFVVAQVAGSLVLLIAAGLFVQSLSKALRVDLGFDPRGVVTASFATDLQGYPPERRDAFIGQFLERARAVPGVTSAGMTSGLPLSGRTRAAAVATDATPAPTSASMTSVSPQYFQTMRVPFMRGREFSRADTPEGPPVAIVDETLARRLWPNGDPVGQRLRPTSSPQEPWREVVGVVRDVKSGPSPTCQAASTTCRSNNAPRRHCPSWSARPAIRPPRCRRSRSIARTLDRDLPLFQAQTFEEAVRQAAILHRSAASLFSVFGILALLLASIGVYGVAAHAVSLRTREIGIRMSLGARPRDVLWLFVREGLSLSLIGIAIGLGISAAFSSVLTAFLFGLTATDTMTFIGGATTLALVAVIATYLPARRAARVDATSALRHQ